jgi:hypothetical protein
LAADRAPGRSSRLRHGQQLGTLEQTRLQQVDTFEAGVHLQAIHAVGGDRVAVQVVAQFEAITQVVQQAPFERTQQRLQRATFGQGQQGGGVVIEHRRVRIFGGQQADQQFIEVKAAEQRIAIEPGRGAGTFHAPDVLQLALAAKLHFQGTNGRANVPALPRALRNTARSRP